MARRGYPFAVVRPRGDKDQATATINLTYVIDEGPRVYIERINIRGNTRTRDYVIRREFDVAEGDAYNRALIDRAERRLKNLNYFKTVKITNEPGSAPDRIVINVEVEDQPTGEFSLAGGYSTADGFMGEISVGERNLLGRGQYAKASVQYGERARGFELSFAEPFFLGYRLAAAADLYAKQTLASSYYSYENKMVGTGVRAGFAISEEITLQPRYSIYQQEISLPDHVEQLLPHEYRARLLRRRRGLARGPQGAGGWSGARLACSATPPPTTRSTTTAIPTSGLLIEFKQDFAGVGGDVNFIRTTVDARSYYEVFNDVVAVLRLQGGHIAGWGDKELRMLDHFQMGPNLVRGFAPAGIGPRDLTPGTRAGRAGRLDVLGRQRRGADAVQLHPEGYRHQGRGLRRRRFALGLPGTDLLGPDRRNAHARRLGCGPCVGRRRPHLEFAVRTDALRLFIPGRENGLRPRSTVPVRWRNAILTQRQNGPRHWSHDRADVLQAWCRPDRGRHRRTDGG